MTSYSGWTASPSPLSPAHMLRLVGKQVMTRWLTGYNLSDT